MEQFADVFNGGVFQKVVPGVVVVSAEDLLDGLFQVRKVHHHAVLKRSFDNALDPDRYDREVFPHFGWPGREWAQSM